MKLPIPQDWDGETWCRWSVCWPQSEAWEGILRGFLTLPQRGRTWDERTGSILDIQAVGREITYNNLPLECVIMSCGDATEVIAAINTNFAALIEAIGALNLNCAPEINIPPLDLGPLTEAIEMATVNVNPTINVTGGGGCGCSGSGSSGNVTVNVTCAPIGPGSGQPGSGTPGAGPGPGEGIPPGLPGAVSARQCRMAQWMIDNYLRGMTSTGAGYNLDTILNNAIIYGGALVGEAYLGAILGGLFGAVASQIGTPGPTPDDPIWIAIGAAVGTLIASGLGSVDFTGIVSFVDENRDALVCSLASSTNATTAKANLMAIVNNSSSGLNTANKTFIGGIFSTTIVSLLFYVNDNYTTLETYIAANIEDDCPCGEADPSDGVQDEEYKCKAANVILDGLGSEMQALGTLTGYSWANFDTFLQLISGGGLLDLLQNSLLGQPTAVIQYFLASASATFSLMSEIIWLGWDFMGAFPLFQAYFATNRAALLCDLVAAEDVAAAKVVLDNAADAAVTSVLTAHPEWAEGEDHYKVVLGRLWPTDLLNILFPETPDPEIEEYEGDACDDCGGGGEEGESCFTFDDDLQGWTTDTTYAEYEFGAAGSLSQADGKMIMTSASAGGLNIVTAKSPTFTPHAIVEGDVICISIVAIPSASYSFYCGALIDGVEVGLFAVTGSETPTDREIGLGSYIGQDISQVFIAWSKGGGSYTVEIAEVGVNCAACAD